jgi:RNA 3'-terminal phosphate cyclase (ATP)
VRACANISSAEVEGGILGSTELKFFPRELKGGTYEFNVAEEKGSAGSVSLVIQSILLPLLFAGSESQVTVKGGTQVPFSPPFDYVERVLLSFLKKLGVEAEPEIVKYGFYPKGGGEVRLKIKPVRELKTVSLENRGKLMRISGTCAVSNLSVEVAKRERTEIENFLGKENLNSEIEIREVSSIGPGNYVFLLAGFGNSLAGFSALGERGKPAERVAQEACLSLLEFLKTEAALEEHLADQVLPFLVLAKGSSSITVSKITSHLLTNVWVVEKLMPARIRVDGQLGQSGGIEVCP